MSIPSDSNASLYCPSQSFGTRMVMIPSVHLSDTVYPINCTQPGMNYQLNTTTPYRIIRYNSPAQYQQIMTAHAINLHGNENNTTVKSMKKSLPTDNSTSVGSISSENARNEDPIDLSSTNLNNFGSSSRTSICPTETEIIINAPNSPKKFVLKSPKKEPISPPTSQPKGQEQQPEIQVERDINRVQQQQQQQQQQQRKRKSSLLDKDPQPQSQNQPQTLIHERELEGWVGHVKPVPGIPRQAGSKREEVLKAARSLFSKRTRTLYHWLYPSTSKNKLKATVAAAWDTLSTAEKDFYISQVLGRFGVPAGSLMVNPQLGGFKGLSGVPNNTAPGNTTSSGSSTDEAGHAVSNLLLSEDDVSWTSYPQAQTQEGGPKKRRRQKNNNNGEGGSTAQQPDDEETLILRKIREEGLDEDFIDDPELSQEFEQFRMFLNDDDLDMNLDEILGSIV